MSLLNSARNVWCAGVLDAAHGRVMRVYSMGHIMCLIHEYTQLLNALHWRVKDDKRFSGSEVKFNSVLPRVLLVFFHSVSNLKDDAEGKLLLKNAN